MLGRRGARVVVVVAVAGAGVALWLTGRLPFWKPPGALLADAGDVIADDAPGVDAAPSADASARPVRRQPGPLSSAQLGAPLLSGHWFSECGAPDTMKLVVKMDVRQGRAVKIDVKTDPTDPVVIGCIERAASDLRWDISPRTGHVTVRY
jgi:hypothetical protein